MMGCVKCGMGRSNDAHRTKRRRDYHEFEPTPEPPYVPTLEERVEALEEAVAELKAQPHQEY